MKSARLPEIMVMDKSQKSKREPSRSSYHMIVQPNIVGQSPQSFQQVNVDRLTSAVTMALMRQVDISSNPAVPFQRLVKSFALHQKGFWVVVGVTVNLKQWRFETVCVI
jgi:hypothetical protein